MHIEPFTVRLDPPLETARGTIRNREGFLVTVEYQGTDGIGEATPLPGWTESLEECRDALDRSRAVGDELDWGVALAKLDAPAARHGLSLAFAEANARANERPLYRYLDAGERGANDHAADGVVESVPVNATLGAHTTPAESARVAPQRVKEGYSCLKLKVGSQSVEDDLERVRAIRDAVEDVDIRVDANGAWTVDEASRALEGLAALDVEYVEQPLPTAALEATCSLREQGVDIALDESLAAHDVETILDLGAADVLVIKPMVVGGPDIAREAASQCRAAGVEPVISTTVDAVVARTAAVHVAASIPDVGPCGLATGDRLSTDLVPDPAPVSEGRITVPQQPGLGLEVRP